MTDLAKHATLEKVEPASSALTFREGRWIDGWDAENLGQWEGGGKQIARRNLNWSIFAEFLGFVVWQLWSIVITLKLNSAGFNLTSDNEFWLISLPILVGATLRVPYSFLVPRFGGRNWTIISAGLLLIPTIGMGYCLDHPDTPYSVLLLLAGLAGFGGGNFASSMSNITYFYPQREKGWALGLNAAGGNLGAAVAQFVVPIVVTFGIGSALHLPLAGYIWVPFILLAMWGAWKYMDNLSNAKADFVGSLAAVKEPHMWILAFLYIGTFGSFIGFAGVFPKLIKDQFKEFSSFNVAGAAFSLAFLGALIGSIARPYGGKLADRFGGARVTMTGFVVMAVITLTVVKTMSLHNFWLYLTLFLGLFAAAGISNGSTYRMIPTVFAVRAGHHDGTSGDVSVQRKAAAALGFIAAIGAFGGFFIAQALRISKEQTHSYDAAFYGIVGAYVLMFAVTYLVYGRRGSALAEHKI